jgi:hypothetical protein
MQNKTVLACMLLILMPALAIAAPYASITFAEGTSFTLIRNNVSSVWKTSDAKVFGMEIKPGDIINTAGSTFLELLIAPIQATVQIAENTSYKVSADDSSGQKSSGELYYGRVRAKVAKLSGSSSFRISSPSLVAGVRGTDFGCDVIAQRDAKTPVLNRVFCFEGSVSVSETVGAESKNVLIGGDEMVEKVVLVGQSSSAQQSQSLIRSTVSGEVREFWSAHPLVSAALPVEPKVSAAETKVVVSEPKLAAEWTVTDRIWPAGTESEPGYGRMSVLSLTSVCLVGLGSFMSVIMAGYAQATHSSLDQSPLYIAGGVMIGSGALFGLVSTTLK